MRTEDVLAAIATGLWRWDNAAGYVTLDAEGARLMGLPAEPTVLSEAAVRARVHPVDWNETNGIVQLAVAEGTLAEAHVRVMGEDGQVIRTIRTRSKPTITQQEYGEDYELIGTVQEVVEPQAGALTGRSPVAGDWRRSREAFLLDAGRALAEARSTTEVLRVAASLSMPGFSPDGLAVFGIEGEQLTIIGHHGQPDDAEGPFTDMSVNTDYPAAEVVRTGQAIYLPTPKDYHDRYPATWPLVQGFGRRSWAFVPLIVAGRTMGAWMAAFKNPVTFTPDERSVLTTVARMLAQALARAEVTDTERELSLGLQRSMMPTLGPAIPGMTVAARYVPTGGGLQVGGDWYDMIPLPGSGKVALVIGDVQGHDVRAAGLMGQLRVALRAYAAEGHRPDAVLARASRFLHGMYEFSTVQDLGHPDRADESEDSDETMPRFATCLYMEVDPVSGTLDIARAGHPDPVIRSADGRALIRQTVGGLPLGIEEDSNYPTTRVILEPGDTIMLCTDGLIETGGHDMLSGWTRLRPVLENNTDVSMEKLADALIEAVHGPRSHYTTGPLADRRDDDIALMLLCRETTPARPRPHARRTALTISQADPEQVSDARRQLKDLLHDWMDEEQVDSAVLMVSEMATNVLVHTDGDAVLIAEAAGERGKRRLRVEVADASDELPHKRRPGELASSGRGLVLMEMLADAWGVDPRGEGKSIWFEIYEEGEPDGSEKADEEDEDEEGDGDGGEEGDGDGGEEGDGVGGEEGDGVG